MKKQNWKWTALLLCASIGGLISCGEEAVNPIVETGAGSEQTVLSDAETKSEIPEYSYDTPDLNGYQFRVLATDALWDMCMKVDVEATDGEVVNDAIYNRNRKVESLLNCHFAVTDFPIQKSPNVLNQHVKETILAAEDLYDVMYASVYVSPAMVTDGYFMNLLDVDGLQLQEPWWDQSVISQATLDDCLFFVTSPMHLMAFDGAWALFFNQSMMDRMNLELPYQAVRDGSWTVDTLLTYCKAAANLNGDPDWNWHPNGNAVYGISSHVNAPDKFILGCGGYVVTKNEKGETFYAAQEEPFLNILSALVPIQEVKNGYNCYFSCNDFSAEEGGYVHIFAAGRSMFLTAEIKAAQLLRDMKDTFGILPYPKVSKEQDSYYSSFVNQCLFYTIPVTNTHLRETAIVSDLTSYQSYADVLPVYYGNTVEQKGLRNDDSIEMLDLIRETSTIDISLVFGWSSNLFLQLHQHLLKGDTAFASTIEKESAIIQKNIQKTMEAIRTSKALQ